MLLLMLNTLARYYVGQLMLASYNKELGFGVAVTSQISRVVLTQLLSNHIDVSLDYDNDKYICCEVNY